MRLDEISQQLKSDKSMTPVLYAKWLRLINTIQAHDSILVAFSGGVDSSLLAYVASLALGNRMIAVTVISGLESKEILDEASAFTSKNNIMHKFINIDPFRNPAFQSNPPDRCYVCKSMILLELWVFAKKNQYQTVIEGQNMDDLKDYRPGQRAIKETGTISPLADCGFSKTDVRTLARMLDLSVWNKPSSPCLATRFPFGVKISQQDIKQVAEAEQFLHGKGFLVARVRHLGEMAVIEIDPNHTEKLVAISPDVINHFESIGFKRTCLDLKGYRMGSMNQGLV